MPVDFTIGPPQGFVHTRFTGEVTDADLRAHQARLAKHPDFDPAGRQIIDLTDVDRMLVSASAVQALVERDPWTAAARRVSVAETELAYGLARMHAALLSSRGQDVRVFRRMDEARAFLGLESAFEPS